MSDDLHFSRFVREIIRIRLYGLEHVQRIAAERLEAVAGKGARQGRQGAAMGFPDDYRLPEQHREAVHLLGNAVCPPVAADLIQAIREAA